MSDLKRIMSFDGGGIRGVFALQIARKIESLLRDHHNDQKLVLADVCDMFAGTSTGAIIATFLAWGKSVDEVEAHYIAQAPAMFARERPWKRWRSKYRSDKIAGFFQTEFVEDGKPALLGSAKLRKRLLVVMRNASTGSPWPISNNPAAMFNAPELDDSNLRIPLWQLLRGSTAAPTYFAPEEIMLGKKPFLFVDGGVTPFNNPALLAFLMATLPCYRENWPATREALHVTSIGTGLQRPHLPKKLARWVHLLDHARWLPPAILGAVSANQDLMCRVTGDCVNGSQLDSEIGCLDTPSIFPPAEQKFTYARFNCSLETDEYGPPLTRKELRLDNVKAIKRLQEIGTAYAERAVRWEHLNPRVTAVLDQKQNVTAPSRSEPNRTPP